MPRVPTITGPSVELAPLQGGEQTAPRALGGAGLVVADQFGQAAKALAQGADIMARERDQMDQVRVDDALNKLKERQLDLTFGKDAGFVNIRGVNALERPSGQPLAEEYAGQLQKASNDLENGLASDRQRRLFALRANDVLTGFRGQVMRHEGEQADAYALSVREGTIANRQNEAAAYWNDPARIDGALQSIEASVADMGRRLGGKSAEWIQARTRQETSKAVGGAVANALERNDFMTADALLKSFGERMTADDLVKARSSVDKHLDAGIAQQAATVVMTQMQPKLQPTDFDRVVSITVQSESGGNPNAVSPKGAKGVMQVMDATNRDPGFGVRPAADSSPGERARVGRDYLAAMVQRYGGDLGQAWAAYNAGPGAVDKAIEQAHSPDMAKRGKLGDWIGFLPKETQDYVAKNLAAYQAGDGKPAAPTLQDVQAAVRERVGTGNPVRLKLALDEAARQYEVAQKAIKQRDDEALAAAHRWLAANGGRYSAMPASIRGAVPADKLDTLLTFSDRIAKGEDRTNPAVYQQLTNPDTLRSLSDSEFYTLSMRELSEADRKHFAGERQKLLTGAGSDKPGDLNSAAVKAVLDNRLRELRIDPTPKDDGGKDAMRVGTIRQFVDRSILNAQQAAGKKFTDAEVAKHIDSLFAQTDTADRLFGDKKMPMLSMTVSDIPGDIEKRLRKDLAAQGIEDPTDGQILGSYWAARAAARRRQITPLPKGPTQ